MNKSADSSLTEGLVDSSVNTSAESSLTGGLNSSDSKMSVDVSETLVLSAMGHSGPQDGQNQTISAPALTAARYSC